jgi:CBS domain-containing protein
MSQAPFDSSTHARLLHWSQVAKVSRQRGFGIMTIDRAVVPETRVRDIMRGRVITIPETATLNEAARTLWHNDISGAPVVAEDGRVVGVISMRDLLAPGDAHPEMPAIAAAALRPAGTEGRAEITEARMTTTLRVREAMTPARFTVRPEATLHELARFLVTCEAHRALVMDGERLVGIVTATDVVRALATSV